MLTVYLEHFRGGNDLLVSRMGAATGYSCILFLFWAFAPFIVAFSAVARLENLQTIVPSLHVVVMLWPVTRTVWNGLASSLALGLFDSW